MLSYYLFQFGLGDTSREAISLWYISPILTWIFLIIWFLRWFLPSLREVYENFSSYSSAKIQLHGKCYVCGEAIEGNDFVTEKFYMDDSSYEDRENSSFCRSKHKKCPSLTPFKKIVCSFDNISGDLCLWSFLGTVFFGVQYLAFGYYRIPENSIEYIIAYYSFICSLSLFFILIVYLIISHFFKFQDKQPISSYLKQIPNPNFTLPDVIAFKKTIKQEPISDPIPEGTKCENCGEFKNLKKYGFYCGNLASSHTDIRIDGNVETTTSTRKYEIETIINNEFICDSCITFFKVKQIVLLLFFILADIFSFNLIYYFDGSFLLIVFFFISIAGLSLIWSHLNDNVLISDKEVGDRIAINIYKNNTLHNYTAFKTRQGKIYD